MADGESPTRLGKADPERLIIAREVIPHRRPVQPVERFPDGHGANR